MLGLDKIMHGILETSTQRAHRNFAAIASMSIKNFTEKLLEVKPTKINLLISMLIPESSETCYNMFYHSDWSRDYPCGH